MPTQSKKLAHLETLTQNIVGQLIGFGILFYFEVKTETAVNIQITFLILAYLRGYLIRRLFERFK